MSRRSALSADDLSFLLSVLLLPAFDDTSALSVVISAILSDVWLHDRLTMFGKLGALLCILGCVHPLDRILADGSSAVIVALNGPTESSTTTILAFQALFVSPGFLAYVRTGAGESR